MKKKNIFFRLSNFGRLGIIILSFFFIIAFIGIIIPKDFYSIPSGFSLEAPSFKHLLGTDDIGIDIFFQICRGTFTTILIGLTTSVLAGFGGSIIGVISALSNKKIDFIISGITDLFLIIPHLPLLIMLGSFLGASIHNIIIAITLLSWVEPAKITRGKILSLKNEKFMLLSKYYGASIWYIIIKHIIPIIFPLLLINMIKIISKAVLMEASLTFLGLGDPSGKSWGLLLNHAMSFPGIYYTEFWKWWILPPIFLLITFILAISWIGRDFENILNKKN